ncbi:MAG: putative molybdenum carrier protein [Verrucomicrobiae bacterium]
MKEQSESQKGGKNPESAPGKLAVPPGLEKLISGGQTGADRAGLDVAIRHGFPHGGWCPKGRKAEDGRIGGQYQLVETPSWNYLQRTEWNVRDTDGTVVFTLAKELTGGSLRTIAFARKHKKPCLHISRLAFGYVDPALPLQQFVAEHGIRRLNVAGPRASKEPGIWQFAYQILEDAFFWSENHEPRIGGPDEG